jgi:tRNA threonylcarbamoyladenosine biosynthesis protein TsaB
VLTLAIVTSTPQVSVALGSADGLISTMAVRSGRRHAEVLVPAIEACFEQAGLAVPDLELVAVDTGPGLFTGLRVGVATAKALASALGIGVVSCSSLDLLAHPHRQDGSLVASVVDARRGEVFWALYRPSDGRMLAVNEPAVASPAALADALAVRGTVLLTGDGARRYAAELAAFPIAVPEHDHPTAPALLDLAATRPALDTDKVTPTYIRGADVRIHWEKRNG